MRISMLSISMKRQDVEHVRGRSATLQAPALDSLEYLRTMYKWFGKVMLAGSPEAQVDLGVPRCLTVKGTTAEGVMYLGACDSTLPSVLVSELL